MHKKILYFDFDETITASADKLIYLANKEFKTKVKFGSHYKYDFTDIFPQMTEPIKYFSQPEFFQGLRFIDRDMLGVLKVLHRLNFDLRTVTIGCKKNIELKIQWIQENLPFFNLKDSHFIIKDGLGKGEVDLSDGVLIDDALENLITSNAWHKICFGKVTEYNEQAENLGYFRASNSLILFLHICGLVAEGEIEDKKCQTA